MADAREYVSRPDELGNIHISEEVLAVIAAAAALETEGVASLAPNLGSDLAELLGKKNLSKGVQIAVNVASVSVFSAIGNTSGLHVECVNINVGGIAFERELKKA